MFPDTPRGEDLPIAKTYPFGPDDLPEGFVREVLHADDPQIEEAGFHAAVTYLVGENPNAALTFEKPSPDAKPVAYSYLRDPDGTLVATWDEGRWWTPEESEAFHLMLKVPGAVEVGIYGMGPKLMRDFEDGEHYADWCRKHFELLNPEGGVWGVPRSGLVFERRGEKLYLIRRDEGFDALWQEEDLAAHVAHFAAAGIEIVDET